VSDRSDSELIEESLDRPAAFDEIFSRYSWTVFGFIARRVGRGNAADLTGEVFARAFAARSYLYPVHQLPCFFIPPTHSFNSSRTL